MTSELSKGRRPHLSWHCRARTFEHVRNGKFKRGDEHISALICARCVYSRCAWPRRDLTLAWIQRPLANGNVCLSACIAFLSPAVVECGTPKALCQWLAAGPLQESQDQVIINIRFQLGVRWHFESINQWYTYMHARTALKTRRRCTQNDLAAAVLCSQVSWQSLHTRRCFGVTTNPYAAASSEFGPLTYAFARTPRHVTHSVMPQGETQSSSGLAHVHKPTNQSHKEISFHKVVTVVHRIRNK